MAAWRYWKYKPPTKKGQKLQFNVWRNAPVGVHRGELKKATEMDHDGSQDLPGGLWVGFWMSKASGA